MQLKCRYNAFLKLPVYANGSKCYLSLLALFFCHCTSIVFTLFYHYFLSMKGCWIRLVNTHLAAAHNETQQNRDKRIIQANQLIQGLECGWDFAILGMDLNDSPLSN